MSKFRRPRFLIFYALVPLAFLTASSSAGQFRLGVPIVCLGLLIRLWANSYVGHRKVNASVKGSGDIRVGRLITAGPYAHVRHPLYVGTFLIVIGVGVIVGRWLPGLLALAALAAIYHRKMAEEERTLEEEWGETFLRYRRSVPRWLPRLRPYARAAAGWSWQGIAASKEWKTTAWVVVALIALYLRDAWLRERVLFAAPYRMQHVLLISLALALMAADGIAELARRR